MEIIDAFVTDAVGRLVRTTDFTEVAKNRAIIVSHQIAQAQYAQRFSEAVFPGDRQGLRLRHQRNHRPGPTVHGLHQPADPRQRAERSAFSRSGRSHDPPREQRGPILGGPGGHQPHRLGQAQPGPEHGGASSSARILDACSKIVETSSAESLYLIAQFAGRYNTRRPRTCWPASPTSGSSVMPTGPSNMSSWIRGF